MYIFLDTTTDFTLGLLDKEFNWLSFEKVTTKRTSEILHEKIFTLLNDFSLKIDQIEAYFSVSGPGSYTGMRVSEGLNQILELEGKKIISFPSYFLAEFVTSSWDLWVYPAFKNEVYTRDSNGSVALVNLDIFKSEIGQKNLLTFGGHFSELENITNTEFVLKNSSREVFSRLLTDAPRSAPFYFRPQEVEFQKSIK